MSDKAMITSYKAYLAAAMDVIISLTAAVFLS